jgi:hypothetical protein
MSDRMCGSETILILSRQSRTERLLSMSGLSQSYCDRSENLTNLSVRLCLNINECVHSDGPTLERLLEAHA